ncbi:MAG: hypothetical protein KKA19_01405, partial [Candidatus Margulisbacteria bacterium]|nr:hypothetical protein [Candidatus Margulisiibacteriota bacterium]
MSISTYFKNFDAKFPWSFLGFLFAIIFGLFSIYLGLFKDTNPIIKYEIFSNTSVLDVKENISNLEIVYDGIDIKKSNQSIRLIVFRVNNIGTEDILKSHYDEDDLFGFVVEKGKIIRVEINKTSNEYLSKNLALSYISDDTIRFKPIILESGEYFDIKILILHEINVEPYINPIGKIAKVKKILLSDNLSERSKPSFLFQTFYGHFWTQLVRIIVYFLGFILLMM